MNINDYYEDVNPDDLPQVLLLNNKTVHQHKPIIVFEGKLLQGDHEEEKYEIPVKKIAPINFIWA